MVWTRNSGNASSTSKFYYDSNGRLTAFLEENTFEIRLYVLEKGQIFASCAASINAKTKELDQIKPLTEKVKENEFQKIKKLATNLPELLDILVGEN